MNKLPSKRIYEIAKEMDTYLGNEVLTSVPAIIQYLDEEYEKNKPCEHEETESWNDYMVCKKCKIMFY